MALTKVKGSVWDGEDNGQALSVKDYGAVGDGVADDTAAINAALTAAKNTGKDVYLSGQHLITDQLVVDGCTLVGGGSFSLGNYTTNGTIKITDTVKSAVLVYDGAGVDGCTFYYPNQVTTATPVVYPPTIEYADGDIYAQNTAINARIARNTFVNSYIAIDTSGTAVPFRSTGPARIYNNNICAISVGIRHSQSSNTIQVYENKFVQSFWVESAGQNIRATINNSAVAVEIGDTDGLILTNNLIFGYGTGLKLVDQNTTFTHVVGNLIDGCYRCIDLSESTSFGEVVISGNTFLAQDQLASPAPTDCAVIYGVWTTGTISGFLHTSGNVYTGVAGDHIYIDSSGTTSFNVHIKVNDWFGTASSQDATAFRYSLYINDPSGKCYADIAGTFHSVFNSGINNSTGIYIDGCSRVSIDARVDGYDVGLQIDGTNTNAIYTIKNLILRAIATSTIINNTLPGQVIYQNIVGDHTRGQLIDIPSAATLTLPEMTIPFIVVSGTTNITTITASWWGRKITLKFDGILTVSDAGNVRLNGPFTTSANDTLTICCDGTNWYEVSRSVN